MLIFDEVQCGVGRTGEPFAANLYGVTPDMITTAKALGNGFPCAALMMSDRVAAAVRMDALGTTFGAGPLACAAIEAVIEAIESEKLLERVRRVSAYVRQTCIVGPVTGHQGAGHLTGLRTAARPRTCSGSCWRATSSRGPAVIRTCCGCCRRSSWRSSTWICCGPRWRICRMRRFLDLADFPREEIVGLLELAQRLAAKPEPQALAGKILGLLFFNASLRTLASMQAGMARLGGSSFVITPARAPSSSRRAWASA